MKAAIWTAYGSPEVMVIGNLPKPKPKDNEVLIKVVASTVTAGDCEHACGILKYALVLLKLAFGQVNVLFGKRSVLWGYSSVVSWLASRTYSIMTSLVQLINMS